MFIDKFIPDNFYVSSFVLVLLLIFYAPFVVKFLRNYWKNSTLNNTKKSIGILLFSLIAFAIPLGDVYVGSLMMENLCKEKGGTHIYQTVEVDGYYSPTLYPRDKNIPYSYIEMGPEGLIYYVPVVSRQLDMANKRKIDKPQSRYHMRSTYKVITTGLLKTGSHIHDAELQKTIAEHVNYRYLGGFIDKFFARNIFGSGSVDCGHPVFDITKFSEAVLVPKSKALRERKE